MNVNLLWAKEEDTDTGKAIKSPFRGSTCLLWKMFMEVRGVMFTHNHCHCELFFIKLEKVSMDQIMKCFKCHAKECEFFSPCYQRLWRILIRELTCSTCTFLGWPGYLCHRHICMCACTRAHTHTHLDLPPSLCLLVAKEISDVREGQFLEKQIEWKKDKDLYSSS